MIKQLMNIYRLNRSYNKGDIICYGSHPRIIAIELTNACRMRCIMCPRQFMKRKVGFMTLELFKSIIDQTEGYTHRIALELFGDSLLHPEFDKMVKYMHKKGILAQISTNAMSLDKGTIKKIIGSQIDSLLISLDGVDDESYKKYRGPYANYAIACDNIYNLLDAKVSGNYDKPFIDIRMIAIPDTEKNVKRFKSNWKMDGVDKVSIGTFHSFGGNIKKIDGTNIKKTAWNNSGVCYKPWEGLHICWDGKVVPCCFDYDATVVMGDCNNESLECVWDSDRMVLLRYQCYNSEWDSNVLCRNCTEPRPFIPFYKQVIYYAYQKTQFNSTVKKLRKLIRGE